MQEWSYVRWHADYPDQSDVDAIQCSAVSGMRMGQLRFRIKHELQGTSICPAGEARMHGLRCRSSKAGWR